MTTNHASVYTKSVNAREYWVGNHLLRAGDVVNNSSVTGDTVSDALDTISASGAGPVITLNGITSQTQTLATGTAGTDFAVSSAASTHTFNLPSASATARGVVTTGAQTLAGVKTLSSAPVLGTGTVTVSGSTVTLPAATTTLVGQDTTDILTNKTLTSNTDNVIARGLWGDSGATSVSSYAATAPTSGQVLTATSSSTATWQTPLTASSTNTLTNKSLVDATTYLIDDLDNTKRVQFEVSGVTTGQTRTLTVPDGNITLVGTANTQTLTNKTLTSPVISTISNTGTLTLPTSTDTLVGRATTDTLTNKTMTSNTNNVIARELWCASGASSVSSYAATAPTSGQVLTATSSSTATWQTPSSGITASSTDTLTNKTMTSNTNNVIARELWCAAGASSVSSYAATAPTSGQVLTATGATTATWQTPSSLVLIASGTWYIPPASAMTTSIATTPTFSTWINGSARAWVRIMCTHSAAWATSGSINGGIRVASGTLIYFPNNGSTTMVTVSAAGVSGTLVTSAGSSTSGQTFFDIVAYVDIGTLEFKFWKTATGESALLSVGDWKVYSYF